MKFTQLSSLIILATSVIKAKEWTQEEKTDVTSGWLQSDERKIEFEDEDKEYEANMAKFEKRLANGIEHGWCAGEN